MKKWHGHFCWVPGASNLNLPICKIKNNGVVNLIKKNRCNSQPMQFNGGNFCE